jgi:hypothetical protein
MSGNTTVGGDLNVSGTTTGTFVGDGSGLTGVGGDPFPYTGDAQIIGSLSVTANTGNVEFSYNAPTGPAAWSAGGTLITARYDFAGTGTQNAGLAFGGAGIPSFVIVSCTEEYNGSSWTSGGALITARCDLAGAGTQNAGLAFGGISPAVRSCTEEYDGTSWTAGGALITARTQLAGAGTQNEALAFGGSSPTTVSCTEEYNGTSWSSGGALINTIRILAGAGTQNAGLAFGGYLPPVAFVSCTEEYNGSSWTAGGALITARGNLAGAGTQNAGLAFGGAPALQCTEQYNGSSWSTGCTLINGRQGLAGAGTQNAGLAFGGYPVGTCTEEYTTPLTPTKTFEYNSTSGTTTVSCLIETSAQRYKDNIEPMGSQLSNVMRLQPVEFDWKMNKKHDIGFIAESVRDVYPNLISTNREGEVEGMNYTKLVSALVKSIQEQQGQINNLSEEINKLKNK